MIIRFIIRPFFALVMLVVCVAATPHLLDWVTQRFNSDASDSVTFSQMEVIQKVQTLYESKALSKVTFDDLRSLIDNEETQQFSDEKKAELYQMLTEELKLSTEELISLGSFYQEYVGQPDPNKGASMTDTSESSIQQ